MCLLYLIIVFIVYIITTSWLGLDAGVVETVFFMYHIFSDCVIERSGSGVELRPLD